MFQFLVGHIAALPSRASSACWHADEPAASHQNPSCPSQSVSEPKGHSFFLDLFRPGVKKSVLITTRQLISQTLRYPRQMKNLIKQTTLRGVTDACHHIIKVASILTHFLAASNLSHMQVKRHTR